MGTAVIQSTKPTLYLKHTKIKPRLAFDNHHPQPQEHGQGNCSRMPVFKWEYCFLQNIILFNNSCLLDWTWLVPASAPPVALLPALNDVLLLAGTLWYHLLTWISYDFNYCISQKKKKQNSTAICRHCGNRAILFPCGLWGCIFWVTHKSMKNLIPWVYNMPFMRFRAIELSWIKLKLDMWCSTRWDLGPEAITKWRK